MQRTRKRNVFVGAVSGIVLLAGCGGDGLDEASAPEDVETKAGALSLANAIVWGQAEYGPFLVAEVAANVTLNNAPVALARESAANTQRWFRDNSTTPTGWLQLVNVKSGKCLDRFRQGNGSRVTQFTCQAGNPSQQWSLGGVAGINWIVNNYDGRCMHVASGTAGTAIQVKTCVRGAGIPQQEFSLERR